MSRQAATRPALAALLTAVAAGAREPECLSALAEQIARLDARLSPGARAEIETLSGGHSLATLAARLRDAIAPASIEAAAALLAANESGCPCSGAEPPEPTPAQLAEAAETLANSAAAPFANNSPLRARLLELQRADEVG